MTPEEYRKELLETVHAVAAADGDFIPSAFITVATRTLADAGELADFERCHYRGTGARRRALWMDGYEFDDTDGSARLLVADWRGEEAAETMTQTDAAAVLGRVRAFVEDAQTGNLHPQLEDSTEAYALAKELYDHGWPRASSPTSTGPTCASSRGTRLRSSMTTTEAGFSRGTFVHS